MHVLSLIPLLGALVATTPSLATPLRDHNYRYCDTSNQTITKTVTATHVVTVTASSSASASAASSLAAQNQVAAVSSHSSSASVSKSSAAVSSVSSKAAISSSSASVSKSASAVATSKASSSAAAAAATSSKAASSSASASKAVSSSASVSKAASSSSSAKASSTSSAAASTSTDANEQTYLTLHNNFRAHYGASAVTWNHTLATYAQTASNTCKFAHTGGPYGENLAAGVGGGYNITSGFDSWADEASQYNASNPQYSHFTQVVWKGTKQIGCATSSCADGTIFTGYGANSLYLVCEYYPPGNVIGEFAQNVGSYQA